MLLDLLHDRLSANRAALVLVAVLAALLVACGLAETARADDAQVTVISAGGEAQTLSLAALAGSEDVIERAYTVRSAAGESSQTVTGLSLAAILAAAESDPYGFSYLEVQRPAGGSVLLSREQALDAGAFEQGPPVLYATATGTGFLRPSSDDADLNATDSFEAPQGVTVVLRNGSPLRVRAQASPLRTRPGEPVSFEAIVDRAGAGEQLEYSWYFDDGNSASGADARHSFAKRGSYDVVVGVTTPGDRAGTSAVVTIQVGAPLSGPDRKGGGHRREATAPDHGAANGTRGAVPPGPATGSSGGDAALHKTAAGERVIGALVSATAPADAEKLVGARSGQLKSGGGGSGLPGAAFGLIVTAGLLGAGALVEMRGLRR